MACGQFMAGALARLKAEAVDRDILLNACGAFAAIGRDHKNLGRVFIVLWRMPFRVGWPEPLHARLYPDLQKMGGLAGGRIELAVSHTSAGAHKLNLSRLKNTFVAETVAMRQ